MTARVLLIDNYDSFTFNLAVALRVLGAEVAVHRNDTLSVDEAAALEPTHVVISPGPGRPAAAGISKASILHFLGQVPVLGVCLGHQALGEALGGDVVHAPRLMHGKMSRIEHDGSGVFQGLPSPLEVARYHSLIVTEATLPATLRVTARTTEGEVMAMVHRDAQVHGVQFHPESVLTPLGDRLLGNFLALETP